MLKLVVRTVTARLLKVSATCKLIFLYRSPAVCGNFSGTPVERVNASSLEGAIFTAERNRKENV
jgi:hypothetical protein